MVTYFEKSGNFCDRWSLLLCTPVIFCNRPVGFYIRLSVHLAGIPFYPALPYVPRLSFEARTAVYERVSSKRQNGNGEEDTLSDARHLGALSRHAILLTPPLAFSSFLSWLGRRRAVHRTRVDHEEDTPSAVGQPHRRRSYFGQEDVFRSGRALVYMSKINPFTGTLHGRSLLRSLVESVKIEGESWNRGRPGDVDLGSASSSNVRALEPSSRRNREIAVCGRGNFALGVLYPFNRISRFRPLPVPFSVFDSSGLLRRAASRNNRDSFAVKKLANTGQWAAPAGLHFL